MAYWSVSVFVESSDEESVAGAEADADHNKAFDCDVTDEQTTPEKETSESRFNHGLFGYSIYSSRYCSGKPQSFIIICAYFREISRNCCRPV